MFLIFHCVTLHYFYPKSFYLFKFTQYANKYGSQPHTILADLTVVEISVLSNNTHPPSSLQGKHMSVRHHSSHHVLLPLNGREVIHVRNGILMHELSSSSVACCVVIKRGWITSCRGNCKLGKRILDLIILWVAGVRCEEGRQLRDEAIPGMQTSSFLN